MPFVNWSAWNEDFLVMEWAHSTKCFLSLRLVISAPAYSFPPVHRRTHTNESLMYTEIIKVNYFSLGTLLCDKMLTCETNLELTRLG